MDVDFGSSFDGGHGVPTSTFSYGIHEDSLEERFARLQAETDLLLSYASGGGMSCYEKTPQDYDEESLKRMFAECITGYDD